MKKISLKNADGSLNGRLIAGIISLLIVLIQQVLAVFGIKFAGDWSAIIAIVNTVLTILGMLGVITDVQTVNVSQETTDKIEQAIDDEITSSTTTTITPVDVTDTSANINVDKDTEE